VSGKNDWMEAGSGLWRSRLQRSSHTWWLMLLLQPKAMLPGD
jgi:hypothetical protein